MIKQVIFEICIDSLQQNVYTEIIFVGDKFNSFITKIFEYDEYEFPRRNLLTTTCSEKWEEAAEFASNFDTPLIGRVYSLFKIPKYDVDWLKEEVAELNKYYNSKIEVDIPKWKYSGREEATDEYFISSYD